MSAFAQVSLDHFSCNMCISGTSVSFCSVGDLINVPDIIVLPKCIF